MRPIWYLAALAAVVTLSIVIFFLPRNHLETGKKGMEFVEKHRESVRLAVADAIITAPVLIALEKDFFADAGLDVEVTGRFSSGKGSFEYMLAGKADLSTPATTPVVFHSFERSDYSIFVTYVTTYEGVKIVARQDHGIRVVEDLKGKTIGLVPGTISEILLDSLLAFNKILPEEISTKNYKGDELPGALIKGDVDAISIWEPHAHSSLTRLGKTAFKLPTSKVYRIAINMATMNDFAARHPSILVKAIHALELAISFMREKPEETMDILSDLLEIDRKLIPTFTQGIHCGLSLDQLLILTMENEARWAIRNRYLESDSLPNYLNFIRYQSLESFNPEAVTLTRKPQ